MIMKKKLSYAEILKETAILTVAVAIIAAAVYFFLVPSHASVSSISGLGIVLSNFIPLPLSVITMILNVVLLLIGFVTCGKEFGVKTVYTSVMLPVFLGLFEMLFPNFGSMTDSQEMDTVLYSGGQRGTQHSVQPECIFRRTGYCSKDHEQISPHGTGQGNVSVRYVRGTVRSIGI